MSYKLKKPYTEKEKLDFIVEFNHSKGLRIEEGVNGELYALEPWEKLDGNTVADNSEEYEAELAQKEAERILQLKLSKREVFLALYNHSGITPEEIKSGITDVSALIEFEYANEYYRGNPLIDMIGVSLGYTKEQLDYLFEHKEFPPQEQEAADD